MATTKKQNAAKTITQAVSKPDQSELMNLTLPPETKEGDVYLIVPAGVFGKERWFKKDQMKAIEAGEKGITITLTRKEVAQRGDECLKAATPAA